MTPTPLLQQPRVRLTLMAVASLALVGALIAVLTLKGEEPPQGPGLRGSLSPDGMPPARFALRDQDGGLVDARRLRGRPVVVTFLYTTCEDTCPVTTQQIRGALDRLGHDVPVIAVSVDPANDTALSARRFVMEQHMTGRMHFLVAPREGLARTWRQFGIQPQEKGIDHSARVIVLDRRGLPRVSWPTEQLTPEGLEHDLRLLEKRGS